jgi:regulator of RNase E activity RraB
MQSAVRVLDQWDFYPCHVDAAPASIFLNMWFAQAAPIPGADTLYWVRAPMADPEEHGMGSEHEASTFSPVEDAIASKATAAGLYYVGRIRNQGIWQMSFFGPAGRDRQLARWARGAMAGLERIVQTGSRSDPQWSFFWEFLFPDRERLQWMRDRDLVETLARQGDSLTSPRRIDHWLHFAESAARQRFVDAVAALGFRVARESDGHGEGNDHPFAVCIHREETVELEEIHVTVMTLIELADERGAEYDGWETSVGANTPATAN